MGNQVCCDNCNSMTKSDEDLQSEKKKKEEVIEIAKAVGIVAGLGLLAWGISGLVSSASIKKKTMKAPGRDYYIYRDDFEDNPAAYFRSLRY